MPLTNTSSSARTPERGVPTASIDPDVPGCHKYVAGVVDSAVSRSPTGTLRPLFWVRRLSASSVSGSGTGMSDVGRSICR
jgi:hypothetical protein